jgi:hypothetical protein
VGSHHRTLWEQSEGSLDVSISHNRGTLLFWLQSRPFTLAARVLEGAQDAATGGSRVRFHHRTLWEQAERRLDVTTSHNRGTLFFWLQSRTLTLAARVLEGARDRKYESINGGISPPDTMGAIGRKIGRHYQPQQRNFVVLVTITTFHARCSGAGGRPRSQL